MHSRPSTGMSVTDLIRILSRPSQPPSSGTAIPRPSVALSSKDLESNDTDSSSGANKNSNPKQSTKTASSAAAETGTDEEYLNVALSELRSVLCKHLPDRASPVSIPERQDLGLSEIAVCEGAADDSDGESSEWEDIDLDGSSDDIIIERINTATRGELS